MFRTRAIGGSLFVLSRRLQRYHQIPEVMARLFAKRLAGIPRWGVGSKAMTQRLILGPPKTRSDVLFLTGAAGPDDIISAIGLIDDRRRLAVGHETKGC